LTEGDGLERRERHMAAARISAVCTGILRERLHDPSTTAEFQSTVEEVRTRRMDPWSAAQRVIAGLHRSSPATDS
jgi:hypothetical protein